MQIEMQGSPTWHECIVLATLDLVPNAKRKRFRLGLKTELRLPGEGVLLGDVPDDADAIPGIIPDAYVIDHENKVVICYEVEVSHRLNHDKLDAYYRLWLLLDEYDYGLGLITVDRHCVMRILDVPLIGMYLTRQWMGRGELDMTNPEQPRFIPKAAA